MDDLIGLTIDHFQILRLVGRGGMSSVYLALDKELEREVALKVPHSRFINDSSFTRRFRREAKAMARLRHTNIVQIFSVGSHGDMPFFAMEYVEGESLSELLKREGPLDVRKALDYLKQILRAIDCAHKSDIIHRDIKPSNVLADSSGRMLVTDFGVSKILSDETSHQTIGVVGTPRYMSPEQCEGCELDHRTDLYSLGVLLFEMLSGIPPFTGDTPEETMQKHLRERPRFPEDIKQRLSAGLQNIVSKMLEKDRDNRYESVSAVLLDIENLGQDTTAPLLRRESKRSSLDAEAFISEFKSRRKRWSMLVTASLIAVCVIGFALSRVLAPPKPPEASGIRSEQEGSTKALHESKDASDKRQHGDPNAMQVSGIAASDSKVDVSKDEPLPDGQMAMLEITPIPPGADVTIGAEHVEEIRAEAAKKALIPKSTLIIRSNPSRAHIFGWSQKRKDYENVFEPCAKDLCCEIREGRLRFVRRVG